MYAELALGIIAGLITAAILAVANAQFRKVRQKSLEQKLLENLRKEWIRKYGDKLGNEHYADLKSNLALEPSAKTRIRHLRENLRDTDHDLF